MSSLKSYSTSISKMPDFSKTLKFFSKPNSSIESKSMSTYSSKHNKRPKKKIYHREPDLDKVMDLSKKPTLILHLKNLIASQKSQSILLRDLEKEVGFVQKWNFMSVIQKHTTVFKISGGSDSRTPISVKFTDKAKNILAEENNVRVLMEPVLVRKLKKLLMMSMDCQVPLEKIHLIRNDLGLPEDFKKGIVLKYPEFFSLKEIKGKEYVCLESWESSLAVTAREENFNVDIVNKHSKYVAKDGNYSGPFAFKMKFAPGFRANMGFLEEVKKWQKLAFPSPYLNARKIEPGTPQARKRTVAVLHELLSLTVEKRLTSDKLDVFHNEYQLPCKLLLCLVKNHGIFYITNKGARSTVFLKEGYDGVNLVEKCPLKLFEDRLMSLIGRACPSSSNMVAA